MSKMDFTKQHYKIAEQILKSLEGYNLNSVDYVFIIAILQSVVKEYINQIVLDDSITPIQVFEKQSK